MKMSFFLFIMAYAAGSVNFSIILFKILGKGDPRDKFSKNAGATNVYRQAGLSWAVTVLFLDAARALGVSLASVYFLDPLLVPWVGLGLVLGNRFPCFHGFRGGKGVANYLGFTLIAAPVAAGISMLAWGFAYGLVRTPFIASFTMIFILAGGTVVEYGFNHVAASGSIITALVIYYAHKSNVTEFLSQRKKSRK